jgi:hypothetical protein
MPKVDVQAAAQRRVLGARLQSLPKPAVDALTRSADAHYASTIYENKGEAPGGEQAAYEASMRAVLGEWKDETGKAWGGPAKIGGGMGTSFDVTIPPWMRKSDFPIITKSLSQKEIEAATGLPGFLGYYRGRPATLADYRSAVLMDAGAGQYYVVPDPNRPNDPIRSMMNLPEAVVLDLNVIRETLKQRAPSAVK